VSAASRSRRGADRIRVELADPFDASTANFGRRPKRNPISSVPIAAAVPGFETLSLRRNVMTTPASHRLRSCCVLALAIALTSRIAHADDFFFKDGDTVVIIGDSITEQHLYSNYVEMWTVSRFPAWKLTFRNVGIGGDRAPGGNGRFKRDVLFHKPKAMTVDFGMNDGGYGGFREDLFNAYMNGLQGMADQAKAANIRVAWITPQPLDNADPGSTALTAPPYNQTLEKFSDGVKSVAAKNGGRFVDQFHPYLAVLDKARGAGGTYARITGGDAIHPGPPGQALMAASILKGLHFPRLVSSVEIDAPSAKVSKATNCKVTNVTVAKDGHAVQFMREDAGLPFFPEDAKPILPWSPILDELNDYGLRVTNLAAGRYEIRLNGQRIAERTADELAAGVNLARWPIEPLSLALRQPLVSAG
jgi:lysophospholipase L1-like esterase